nr:GntR family transcriptional regulator [Microvirga antarctica]
MLWFACRSLCIGRASGNGRGKMAKGCRRMNPGQQMAKASNLAYDAIRAGIMDGRYAAHSHLREAVIAAEIGVSRTPVREALRRLAADGFVTFVANQGAYVTPWSDESFSELISVRAELAGLAAGGVARHANASEIAAMEDIVRAMALIDTDDNHTRIDEQTRLNVQFHEIISRNCGNRWLAALLQQTSNVANIQRAYYAYSAEDWARAVSRYAEMIKAFRAGDGVWAAAVFKSHFLASRNAIMSYALEKNSSAATAPKLRHRAAAKRVID